LRQPVRSSISKVVWGKSVFPPCPRQNMLGAMHSSIPLPDLSPTDRTHPAVVPLLEVIRQQDVRRQQQDQRMDELREALQRLKDEIAHLKGHTSRPKLRPSALAKGASDKPKPKGKSRPGSKKRKKTTTLAIHDTAYISAPDVPPGSRFKGYLEYTVQDIEIHPHNTRYLIERWETPDGQLLRGVLPEAVQGGHFGPTLVSYILYQYHQCHVTQPLLLEALHEWGIDISAGQIDRLLTEDQAAFHAEKAGLLSAGLSVSAYIHVDDTGARHQGKNGYCTHIGNDFFAWFESTNSKSRINFLSLLRAGYEDYVLDAEAIEYLESSALPRSLLPRLSSDAPQHFVDEKAWAAHLDALEITTPRHRQFATEGALLGSVLFHGVPKSLAIVSDDAGQFNLLEHALCWIHAERTIDKIIPYGEKQRQAIQETRTQIWQLYKDLKAYKSHPTPEDKTGLETRFDTIFTTPTCDTTLTLALQRLHANKAELLLVLARPEIPLHNNLSERDIREYVKRRKISGSTRSEKGRQARDTFISLKKTGRKLGISFWKYLQDRIGHLEGIPPLSELIRQQAQAP